MTEAPSETEAEGAGVEDAAETDMAEPVAPPAADAPPETGDLVIDASLRDLAAAPHDDLAAQLEAGEQVHRTLQGRLSDLSG